MHKFILPSNDASWIQRDLATLWHPCTQMAEHPDTLPLIAIKSGSGVWLQDYYGKQYLDAISSWWTNLFGHSEPRIANAIAEQARTLEHVIFAGFSHQPGLQLAERLVALAPAGLTRVFYADNGSAAIEVALKMSFQYFANQGLTRKTRFFALQNSYHGETLGALSMGDLDLYRRVYAPLLQEPIFVPSPDYKIARDESEQINFALRAAESLHELLKQHHHEVCALIVEPLVQCAGGMRMYHPIYLQKARDLCSEFGVHLIADEIAVGFGRTGTLFACEQANISPDFLCLSKGLTGGFLPMSAVLTTQAIFEQFLSSDRSRGFLHSHSYTGNPLGCAAANACLEIFERDEVLNNNLRTIQQMQCYANTLRSHPNIMNVRQTGMILAMDIGRNQCDGFDPSERRGLRAYRAGLERGVIMRPLGDCLYWMPPYCINEQQLQFLFESTIDVLNEICA